MSSPSIYRPDWSLPLAVAVLVGGSLLAAGIVYLLTISADSLTGSHQARLAESQSQGHAWSVECRGGPYWSGILVEQRARRGQRPEGGGPRYAFIQRILWRGP